MPLPEHGLYHNDGLEKAKRFANMPFGAQQKCNLVNSVINQVKIAEGDGSARAVAREVAGTMKNQNWNDNPKARPGGFIVSRCFKECKFRDTNICEQCIGSDMFEQSNNEEDVNVV